MQFRPCLWSLLCLLMPFSSGASAAMAIEGTPATPFEATADRPAPLIQQDGLALPVKTVSGPLIPSVSRSPGGLNGRILYLNAGHGWAWTGSAWALGRPVLNEMNEDYGNLDQMTLAAYYFFNAGATVVPFRPVGNQTNEVVLSASSGDGHVLAPPGWAATPPGQSYASFAYVAPATVLESAASEVRFIPRIPDAGVYPVYTWVSRGSNRVNQLYRVLHLEGESRVRVPHQMVGNGWVYLGSYPFAKGENTNSGVVCVSNFIEAQQPGGAAIADTLRFGNGMGDVDRGGGISGYPREEEASRYWIQRALAPWQSSTIYDSPSLSDESDNVGAPIRMAAEMNRESEGNMFKRVYVSFHSNAGGGRGVLGLYNNPALSTNVARNSNTPNQARLAQLLAQELNNDLAALSGILETPWFSRGANVTYARSDFAFGEINNNTISNEFDATIIEVAFHDDPQDAKILRDPKARNWAARAVYQGVVRYMHQFDAVPLVFAPEPPSNVRAIATNYLSGENSAPQPPAPGEPTFTAHLAWSAPDNQGGAGSPEYYRVRLWNDAAPASARVVECTNSFASVPSLNAGHVWYARVSAVNGGGESMPSEVVACRSQTHSPPSSRVLFVNGFSRFDRTLNLRQTPSPRNYRPPGHDRNSGAMERVLPARMNSFDYVIQHARAVEDSSAMGLDACQAQAVTNGQVQLQNYQIVFWAAGNQSTVNRTFPPSAQAAITDYQKQGGHLMVSGAEVAWDLDRPAGPTPQDRAFLRQQLHTAYVGDDSGINRFRAAAVPFEGIAGAFNDGTGTTYPVLYPDVLRPVGMGAHPALFYEGGTNAAAIACAGSAGEGNVVFLGFPFESILEPAQRTALMRSVLGWFSRPAVIHAARIIPPTHLELELRLEPAFSYAIESSEDMTLWTEAASLTATNSLQSIRVPLEGKQKFFRTRLAE